jgi:hypothetical protein
LGVGGWVVSVLRGQGEGSVEPGLLSLLLPLLVPPDSPIAPRLASPPPPNPNSCIQRLLQDDVNPKLEDLECLCKLLSTIGQQLERGGAVKGTAGMTQAQLAAKQKEKQAEGKRLMDAYFARIQRLVENKSLDSRLRFMLLEVDEQRKRGWAVRRKAEGPMKIEVRGMGGGGVCAWGLGFRVGLKEGRCGAGGRREQAGRRPAGSRTLSGLLSPRPT